MSDSLLIPYPFVRPLQLRLRISNSELQVFKRCKRKWWLAFYREFARKRGIDAPRKALQVGDVVHRALEYYYTPENYQNVTPLDVRSRLEEILQHEREVNPLFVDDIDANGEYARIMLEGYFEWLEETGEDAALRIIAPEQSIEVPLSFNDGRIVTLMGKLDVRVENLETAARGFLETKTVGSFDQFLATAHMNEQILMYHLLEYIDLLTHAPDDLEAVRTQGVILNMIKRVKRTGSAKPPFFKRKTISHSINDLRSFYIRTWQTVLEIMQARDALNGGGNPMQLMYPTVDGSCTWQCEFFPVCSMLDDNRTRAEAMLLDLYEPRDPYERYGAQELGDDSE